MDGAKASSRRDRWLAHAEAAYERMFGDAYQPGMVTLAEREAVAVLIGRELKAFLLQEHVADDPFAQPSHNSQQTPAPCCPKCQSPGKFAPKKNVATNKNRSSSNRSSSSLPSRSIKTEAGDIEVTRERWRCGGPGALTGAPVHRTILRPPDGRGRYPRR